MMIRRDANGKVVEFESDAAVADMTVASSAKPGRSNQADRKPKSEVTREDLEQIFRDEVSGIIARTDAERAAYVTEATDAVALIEKNCSAAKEELRVALQIGITDINRVCRDAIASLKKDNEGALAILRQSRYDALNPLQVSYDLKLAELKARQESEEMAARERFNAGLALLKTEQASDDKLAAVVAEIPDRGLNPNETLDP